LRKKLLFCFFIITISAEAQTSVYHPFPDSNAVWNVEYVFWWACGNPPLYTNRYETFSYVLNGDTAINSYTYHKVHIPFVEINCNPNFPYQTAGYKGCLREDTNARKIYFIYPGDSVDSLLYDFNLQIGDTIRGLLSYEDLCMSLNLPVTIISIDSVLINNTYRKQWNYTNGSIVEGIGSLDGLLEMTCQFPDAPEAHLICFTENGNTIYNSPWYFPLNCNIIDGITDNAENISLEIFPNPATNELRIQNSNLKIESVEIYNVVGEKRLTPTLSKGEGDSFIDVSMLSSGMYFARVGTEKGILTKKFIKQ
jgi:hypothetical protein